MLVKGAHELIHQTCPATVHRNEAESKLNAENPKTVKWHGTITFARSPKRLIIALVESLTPPYTLLSM